MTQIDRKKNHVLWLKESVLSKWLYYPRQSNDVMQSHITNGISHRPRTKSLEICNETQNILSSQCNLEKEKWSWRNQANSRLHYKAIVIQKVWYWHKNINQWKRLESPDISPCAIDQVNYNKGGKTTQWRKNCLFNKWCWENWTAIRKTRLN